MTSKKHFLGIFSLSGLSVLVCILISLPGFSQDTAKTKGVKKYRIVTRVVDDKSGKTLVKDTTFTVDGKLKPGEEKEMMKEIEVQMKGLDGEMKQLQVEMSDFNPSDSGMTDKVILLRGCQGRGQSMRNCCPHGRNFHLETELPEGSEHMGGRFGQFEMECMPGMFLNESLDMDSDRGESLNDLLGDIPMDRVTSYSIKDTKNGKKIIIEIKDEPFPQRERSVIIHRSPGPAGSHGQGPKHNIRKKVIILDRDPEKEVQPDKL